jgi:spermidine synthase
MAVTRFRLAVGTAAFSGFIALSYEIVWYRVLSVMTRGIAATFGLLLAAYLVGLAVGARASAVLCRGERRSLREPHERVPRPTPARGLRALALFVALANLVAAIVAPVFAWSARFTDFRVGLPIIALAAAFLGSVLPLVSHFGIEPDERTGTRLSYVYLANIIGSAAGSLLTGFVLMDRLPIVSIALLLALAGFALAAALVWMSGTSRRVATLAYSTLALCALAETALVPRLYVGLYERLVYKDEYDGSQRFAQIVENKSGVITVTQDGMVYGGGAYDGVVNTWLEENEKNGILRAYVAGAIHPAPRAVLMVGLASGSWAQVVAHLPGVERLTIVEINPGYVEVVAAHADVAGLLANRRVEIVIDDGRRWMQRNDRRFDLIVMNTTLHWRAHGTNLLSTEFMEIARRHLLPGGVFYFNTTNSYDAQLTAARAFPHLMRITNFVAVSDAPVRFDRERWKWLLETMRIEDRPILDLGRAAHKKIYEDLLGFNDMEYRPSILERTEKVAKVITDDNMVVEWREPLRYPELRKK